MFEPTWNDHSLIQQHVPASSIYPVHHYDMWGCHYFDPNAPSFQLKTSNLLDLEDALGLVDYVDKSCTGSPYQEKISSVLHSQKASTKVINDISQCIQSFERSPSLPPVYDIPPLPSLDFMGSPVFMDNMPFASLFDDLNSETPVRSPPYHSDSESKSPISYTQERPTQSPSKSITSTPSSSPEKENPNDYVDIPNRELLAKNPRCGWSRTRTKLCKRYIESFCGRDCHCPFIHAKPLTAHRDQVVFLGGLPKDCSRSSLFKELLDSGYEIINYPIVLDRFTPRVVFKNSEVAQKLIREKSVQLFGVKVDVRAYKQSNEVFQIFLGGVPFNTNVEDLRDALKKCRCELVNIPTINKGRFVINCEVASKKQQERLIARGSIEVLGKRVQVKRLTKRRRRTRSPGIRGQ